jgi:hypothetical protein
MQKRARSWGEQAGDVVDCVPDVHALCTTFMAGKPRGGGGRADSLGVETAHATSIHVLTEEP